MKSKEDTIFNKLKWSKEPLLWKVYEDCSFIDCDLSNADLSSMRFIHCEFSDCNLSNAILATTSFQDVIFRNGKMLGLRFEDCDDFGFSVNFEGCRLDHCSFYKMKMNRCAFTDCQLRTADFSEADLGGIDIRNCDLGDATFDRTNLEKCDLRDSYAFTIDPGNNRMRGARFSMPAVVGLLNGYGIIIE